MTHNPSAFPSGDKAAHPTSTFDPGMSLRDWFAGQAFSSGLILPTYPEWQLKAWFGGRNCLKREEIAAKAAYELADAMLAARGQS